MDSLIPLEEEHRYLESIIERGRQTFIEVGTALLTIREKRTYRADGWDTFEEYCQERWGWTRQRAYQLMDAATVVSTVVDTGLPAPTSERQARELARAPEEQRQEIWQNVVEEHGENVTAANVREAVRLFAPEPRAPEPPPDPVTNWREHDIVHTRLGSLNTLTAIDAEAYVARLGGLAALEVFLRNDAEIAEAAACWLLEYANAVRRRLGDERKGLRAL